MMGTNWKRTTFFSRGTQLILENKTRKIYVVQDVIRPLYSPFPTLTITMAATTTHMKKVNTCTRHYSFGDRDCASIPTTDLIINSDHEDSITDHNIVNLMEA